MIIISVGAEYSRRYFLLLDLGKLQIVLVILATSRVPSGEGAAQRALDCSAPGALVRSLSRPLGAGSHKGRRRERRGAVVVVGRFHGGLLGAGSHRRRRWCRALVVVSLMLPFGRRRAPVGAGSHQERWRERRRALEIAGRFRGVLLGAASHGRQRWRQALIWLPVLDLVWIICRCVVVFRRAGLFKRRREDFVGLVCVEPLIG